MKVTINEIEYHVYRDGDDIICIPVLEDDHTLVAHNGYVMCCGSAAMQAKFTHQVSEIAHELMQDYVLENKEQLIKIEL